MSLGQPFIDVSSQQRPPPAGCLTPREKQVATFICAATPVPEVRGLGQTEEQLIALDLASRYPGYDACEIAQMPLCVTYVPMPGAEAEADVPVVPQEVVETTTAPSCKTDSMHAVSTFCDENPTGNPQFAVTFPDGTTRVPDPDWTCDHPEARTELAALRALPFCPGHGVEEEDDRRAAYAVGGVLLLLLLGGGGYALYRARKGR